MLITLVVDLPGDTFEEALNHLRGNPRGITQALAYPDDMVTKLQERLTEAQRKLAEKEAALAGLQSIVDTIF